MTPERIILGTVLVTVLVLGLGWGAWRFVLWSKRRRGSSGDRVSVPSQGPTATEQRRDSVADGGDEVLTLAAWTVLEARLANPLALLRDLTLEDAIDVQRYGAAVTRFQEREHQLELRVAGDVISVATNVRDLAKAGSQLTFELTSSIRAGLARGTLRLMRDRNGKLLATVQDTRTGKITELLRGAPSGARLGALTAAVYGLAHIVSAKDLATKLDEVSAKVEQLLVLRSIDQRARLEAVYARAKELGTLPLDDAVVEELRGLRQEVRELRYVWRGEVVYALGSLRDPPPVSRVNKRMPGTKKRHAAMHEGVRDAVGRVALMEFSLRLEHLLAVASDEAEPFLRVLPDELGAWDELTDLLQAKAGTIGFEELTAQPYVEAVREVVQVYRGGVDGVLAPEVAARVLPEHDPARGSAGDETMGERPG